jgi:hypothetical protein
VQPATAARGSEAGNGAAPVVAFQTVAAANGSDAGGGGAVGADVTKAQMPGSSQQKEGVVGVEPEKQTEDNAASETMRAVPSAGSSNE